MNRKTFFGVLAGFFALPFVKPQEDAEFERIGISCGWEPVGFDSIQPGDIVRYKHDSKPVRVITVFRQDPVPFVWGERMDASHIADSYRTHSSGVL